MNALIAAPCPAAAPGTENRPNATPPRPLAGVRVLDLSRVLAGPWASQILADYGADMLIENYKVGQLAKYGLDAASLQAVKPRLIYCSITGYGQNGPLAHKAGVDFAIQAEGGLMSITGEPDGEPQKVGVAVTDLITGVYAATAILAALVERDRTGRGRVLDASLFDVQVAMLANQASTLPLGAGPALCHQPGAGGTPRAAAAGHRRPPADGGAPHPIRRPASHRRSRTTGAGDG